MTLSPVLLLLITAHTLRAATLDCYKTFPGSNLSALYNETIAHAIHSMTVDGLKLFKGSASEVNFVPTVNEDLAQEQTVLDHAPAIHLGQDFSTMTMNIVDKILSTLGNSKDGLGPHWSPVERVAHVFHMWDLWITIKNKAWPGVLQNPPSDAMCSCLSSVEFNGVKIILEEVDGNTRELVYSFLGDHHWDTAVTRSVRNGHGFQKAAVKWVAEHYKTGTPITLLNRSIPKLVDADTWQVWKDRLLHYYTPEALNDAAMYLYCVSQFWK